MSLSVTFGAAFAMSSGAGPSVVRPIEARSCTFCLLQNGGAATQTSDEQIAAAPEQVADTPASTPLPKGFWLLLSGLLVAYAHVKGSALRTARLGQTSAIRTI